MEKLKQLGDIQKTNTKMAVINTPLNKNKYKWIKQYNQKTEIVDK